MFLQNHEKQETINSDYDLDQKLDCNECKARILVGEDQ